MTLTGTQVLYIHVLGKNVINKIVHVDLYVHVLAHVFLGVAYYCVAL